MIDLHGSVGAGDVAGFLRGHVGAGEGRRKGGLGRAVEIEERVSDGVTEGVADRPGAHVVHVALVEEEGLFLLGRRSRRGKGAKEKGVEREKEREKERENGGSHEGGNDRTNKIHCLHTTTTFSSCCFFFFFFLSLLYY